MADMSEKGITKHEKEKKRRFYLPLAALLSYLVIISLLLVSFSLAKYTALTADVSGARVAKFDVSAYPNGNGAQTNKVTLSTTSLNTETYAFTVRNTSEVVVRYKITVTNVPAGIDISVNDSGVLTPDNEGTVTFDSDDILGINAEKDCTVTFKAHDEYTAAKVYEEKLKVEVRFEQVD